MSTVSARIEYEEVLRRMKLAVALGVRSLEGMPLKSGPDRFARARALQSALRVAKMGAWRPTFPFDRLPQVCSPPLYDRPQRDSWKAAPYMGWPRL